MNDRNDDAAVDLDELEAKAKAATSGKRRWNVNRKSKCVHLDGGTPQYDLSILCFSRWGMGGATVEFIRGAKPYMCDGFDKAQDVAVPIPGRAHHADWCADIDNPDAAFIAAADPSTVLAVIARCRDAEALIPRYQADLRANAKAVFEERKGRIEAEAEAQALRTALEAMVGLAYENTTHSILPEWQCRYCIRRNRAESLVVHRDGCPVPAADNALALGAKGEKP